MAVRIHQRRKSTPKFSAVIAHQHFEKETAILSLETEQLYMHMCTCQSSIYCSLLEMSTIVQLEALSEREEGEDEHHHLLLVESRGQLKGCCKAIELTLEHASWPNRPASGKEF